MLLTAQRVRSIKGDDGVNAFYYRHGAIPGWVARPPKGIPDDNPGIRVNATTEIEPGGNLVVSYLDIIAPDETPASEVLASLQGFLSLEHRQLPWVATVDRCTFRFWVQPTLVSRWAEEFKALAKAALRVHEDS